MVIYRIKESQVKQEKRVREKKKEKGKKELQNLNR